VATREHDLSPGHFTWLVDGRSANQRSTLELYKLISGNERKLNSNAELQKAAQELTGVAFSLWRAVFLSDTSGEYEDQLAVLKKFLTSLIADNTVLYVTDKNARNWSFRYYLDNAVHRLHELSRGRLRLVDDSDLAKPADTEKDEWRDAQSVLDKAIARFGAALEGKSALS
jgi:hypothetical protein